jgi:TonB family protein
MGPLPLALVVYSAQVMLVVASATVASMVFRLTMPAARLAYWRGVGVLCLALPFLPTAGPATSGEVLFGTATVGAGESGAPAPLLAAAGSLVLWAYAAGAASRLGRLLLGAMRLRQIRARSTRAELAPALETLRAGLAPRAEVRWTDELTQPVTFGVLRPVVLLPQRFGTLNLEGQRSVACHELLHVARLDWLWILAEEHIRAVFWFHPAVWWVLEQVQLSREQVIDRRVVTHTGAKRAYMDALIAFADGGRAASLSMAFLQRRHLKFRLQHLSKEQHMSHRHLTWTMASLVALMVTVAGGVSRALPLDVPSIRVQTRQETSFEIRLAEREPVGGLVQATGPDGARIYLHSPAVATAADVTDASVIDGGSSGFSVAIRFSDAASARMASATRPHLGRPVAILLDSRVVAVATVRTPISDRAVLTGHFSEEEAGRIAASLAPSRAPGAAQSVVPRDAPIAGDVRQPGGSASAPAAAVASQAPSVNDRGDRVTMPTPTFRVNPEYTQAALKAGIEGTVLLSVLVEADGTVGDATVTESLDTVYGLDEQALAAAKQWRFRPGTHDGTPVPVRVTLEMRFTLK